ncbi:MAG: PKD domain-containing protein [Bacteroidota bacterium]
MYYLRLIFLLAITFSMQLKIKGQRAENHILIKPLQGKEFIKEQGQFSKHAKEIKSPLSETVLYGVENSEFNAYFTLNSIIFQFPERRKIEEKDRKKERDEEEERNVETIWHTATMKWSGANTSAELIAEQKVSNYYNYGSVGFDDTSHFNFVPAYKKLKYLNLYPGVDVEFELPEQGGVKYKFIVQPNTVVPDIAFEWEGVERLRADKEGNLLLKNTFSPRSLNSEWKLMDHAPNAYTSSSHTNIPVQYSITGNKVKFEFLSDKISSSEGIVIDPWITTNYAVLNRAFDIQEDSLGNLFIHGNHSNYSVEKYNSSGVLQWTYVTYSIFLGDIAVDNPGNVYIIGGYPAGKRQKLNSSGVQVWVQAGLAEEWRLAFNYSKTVLAVCGYFINPGGNNLARLDLATGSVSDQIAYSEETRSVATDCNGDMYSLHLPTSTLRKTKADFTSAGVVASGLSLIYSGTGYALNPDYSTDVFQGFNGTLVQGPYVYIYDGITLRRFNKTSLAALNSVSVPNGVNYQCSGLAADRCGNVYAGSTNGIVKFDSTLNYIGITPTPGPVYDLLFSFNGELLACGAGFLGKFSVVCTPPPPLNVVASSTDVSCIGGTAKITVTGGIAPYSFLWFPGGQTTDSISNLTAGTYTYSVTDPFCRSFSDTVVVGQVSPFSIAPGQINVVSPGVVSNESCPGSVDGSAIVVTMGGTAPYSYSWNTNPVQHTQTATGLSAGVYLATVVDADSCMDTVSIAITRNPAPVAAFTFTNKCSGTAVPFSSTSTIASPDVITSWNWKFGDNTTGTGSTTSHIYNTPGNYNVTLIVTTNNSCSDTIVQQITVFNNPVAAFTFTNVCLGDSINFTNTSTISLPDSITSYLWNFGYSGNTSNIKTPSHQYLTQGTYNVTLVTTTSKGCSDALTVPVNTFDPPTSAFSAGNTCLMDSVLFSNTTLPPTMGTTASWSWDFGDGSALETSILSPYHLYSATGNYTITLITKSSNLACPDTITHSIAVFPMPLADFETADVCLNEVMNFYDSSTVAANNTITSWSWNFGDASAIGVSQNPVHTYANPGSYTVTLIVTTNNGCKDTITKSSVVHPLPVALISTDNVCKGISSQFINQSSITVNPTNDVIQSWQWNYGDGSAVVSNQNTSHLFVNAGSYPVELLISTSFGCLDSITHTVFIHPNPVVDFIASDTVGCEPLCISFQNASSIAAGTNVSYQWNFGDATTVSNSMDSDHCYNNDSVFSPNVFNVSLAVVSDSGCSVTFTKNNYITAYPLPDAAFMIQPQVATIVDPVITITNLSTGSSFWHWNFGDMDTSLIQNPNAHTYADTGIYSIRLIVSTQYNCIDTMYQTVIVEPDFIFYIPNGFTPDEDGINDTFIAKGVFIKDFEMMIFDRWGNLIYRTDSINKPWDGRINNGNEIAQQDVYVYSIKLSDFKNRKHTYKGIVTLVR